MPPPPAPADPPAPPEPSLPPLSPQPLFSVVVVHYQGTVPHDVFLRGIASLQSQTFRDFEILCYHDGPLLRPELPMPLPVRATEVRFNDFGHSLRDLGIRAARGRYIVHFNADNVLYPDALEQMAREIARAPRLVEPDGTVYDPPDIVIFPIKMFGLQRVGGRVFQFKPKGGSASAAAVRAPWYEILTGNPPVRQNIDCMQLVMRRDLWLAEGGWHDKSVESDGALYEALASKYGYRTVGPILGEHH